MSLDPKKNMPKVGPTGSAVVDISVTKTSAADITHETFAPRPPRRCWWDESDEDDEDYVELTDEELNEATRAFEKAKRLYDAKCANGHVCDLFSGWAGYSPNTQERIGARITCKDGTVADGVWTGDAWLWTSWARGASI